MAGVVDPTSRGCVSPDQPPQDPDHTIFPHDRTWLPTGLTRVVTLVITALCATTLPLSAAALLPISTTAPAQAPPELSTTETGASPETAHRTEGTFELNTLSTARTTAHARLEAAAESAARARAQRAAADQAAAEHAAAEHAAADQAAAEHAAAEQAAPELPAASRTGESASAPSPAPADNHHARAERTADAMPFDWRAHGITFVVGCHPDQSRCSWGTFDYRVDEVWLSSAAFASEARLRYVIAHELAHAWQWSTNLDDRTADLTDFGVSTSDGIEYGADCVAESWGHPVATYWDCPSEAVAHMHAVFAATT